MIAFFDKYEYARLFTVETVEAWMAGWTVDMMRKGHELLHSERIQ